MSENRPQQHESAFWFFLHRRIFMIRRKTRAPDGADWVPQSSVRNVTSFESRLARVRAALFREFLDILQEFRIWLTQTETPKWANRIRQSPSNGGTKGIGAID